MGDYWGVGLYNPDMNIRDGVSAVLINTEKGKSLFEQISSEIIAVPTLKENIARANNLSIGTLKPYYKPKDREAFLKTIAQEGWKTAERRYLFNKQRALRFMKVMVPDGRLKRLLEKLKKHL